MLARFPLKPHGLLFRITMDAVLLFPFLPLLNPPFLLLLLPLLVSFTASQPPWPGAGTTGSWARSFQPSGREWSDFQPSGREREGAEASRTGPAALRPDSFGPPSLGQRRSVEPGH